MYIFYAGVHQRICWQASFWTCSRWISYQFSADMDIDLDQLCSPVCKMQQRGSSGYEWNTFVRVSLRLEPRSRKALEKLSSAARYAFNSLF